MEEIERAVEDLTKEIVTAIEECVPKIKTRKLPHPEIDSEIKDLMEVARRRKIMIMNGVDVFSNKRELNRCRETIREKWKEKVNEMWTNMVEKIDLERDPKEFWESIRRMMGRKKKEEMEVIKNENGDILRTSEEMERAFRRRLGRTFYISEEENENFCEETEREVEEWVRNNENKLVRKKNYRN